MSYTYTCYECRGTFTGRGMFPRDGAAASSNINHVHCPQCTFVLEQRLSAKEQREETDRRYWADIDRRDKYQPTSMNNNVNNSQDAALWNLAGVMAKQVEKIVDKKLNSVKPVNKNRCDPNVVWPEVEKPALNFIEECRIGDVYRRYLEREKEKTHLPPNYD